MKRLAYFFATLPLAAACTSSSSTSSGPTDDTQFDDTAQAIGHAAANRGGDVSAMADVMLVARGSLPAGFTASADGSIDGAAFGLDYQLSLTCKDAGGHELAACDDSTDAAEASVAWSGRLDLPILFASIERDGTWSISGLSSDTATFDGDGSLSFDFETVNAKYHFDDEASYDGVLIDTATQKTVGGSMHYAIDASATRNGEDASFHVDATIVFLSNGAAQLSLDDTHKYQLDLSTGAVLRITA
jgi:hypothetical protein